MRSVCFSGWLVVAASVVLWHCAIDDRAPSEVMAPNQPLEGNAAGAASRGPTASPLNQGAAGSAGDPANPAGAEPASGAPEGSGLGSGGSSGSGGASNGSGGSNVQSTDSPPGAAGSGSAGMTSGGAAGNSSEAPEGPTLPPGGANGSAPSITSTCPAFTACGGELMGTWAYTDACPSANLDLLLTQCPTASVQHESGAPATLSFSGGQVARSGAPVGDGVINFPLECDFACSLVAALVGTAGNCSEVAGDCVCRTPYSIAWSQQSYTVSGSQLTQADGRTFDYCVAGNTLTYRETGDAKEPGVFTLQRN